jgi:hypothetical protein
MIQRLYGIVVASHPLGISADGFLDTFAPYLSKRLVHRIKVDQQCENDWARQNKGAFIKPPFAWLELGLFSGEEDLSEPSQFHITRSELRRGGLTYVYVKLKSSQQTYSSDLPKTPPETAYYWDVAVRVVSQGGRPVVDDVIYLKGDMVDFESRLSTDLLLGCRGSHSVGQKGDPHGEPQHLWRQWPADRGSGICVTDNSGNSGGIPGTQYLIDGGLAGRYRIGHGKTCTAGALRAR